MDSFSKPSETPSPNSPPVRARPQLALLSWTAPWRWLQLALTDLSKAVGVALFYGLCFWAMAAVLAVVFYQEPAYTMSMVSGCLLVGPFLAMGLYDVSRRLEKGEQPSMAHSLTCWDTHLGSMGMLVLVLMLLELIWGRASLVVFAVFFDTGMPSTTGVVQAIFNPDNWEFIVVYLGVGGVFAALVFSSMVVSIPMILDRDTDAISAAITSIQVVTHNVGVMLLWGFLIAVLTLVALLPWGAGLIVIGPLLGFASWHAYRDAVQWTPTGARDVPAPQ